MHQKAKLEKIVCVSVTNDLATDQRVLKVCDFLHRNGYAVTLIGRRKTDSLPFNPSHINAKRFGMLFRRSFLFYAEYNLKLFFYLLFRKTDLLVSNDLDTLLPNYLISILRRKPLVYDAHEYFLGSTEIVNRPLVRKVWAGIERMIFPRLKHVITVNGSIADLYHEQYGIRPRVVRNVPPRLQVQQKLKRSDLGWPDDKKIVLMQGGGINVHRGAEELIMAFQPQYGLKNVLLCFIGGGDVWEKIRQQVQELELTDVVHFMEKMPYDKLMQYTALADIGVSLDKPVSLNYQYSLPNKVFDYISAGVPVLASSLLEVKKIVEEYQVGLCVNSHEPAHIANRIAYMLEDPARYKHWKNRTIDASKELCWENEEKVLSEVYRPFI